MVATGDLKSPVLGRTGSTPVSRTKFCPCRQIQVKSALSKGVPRVSRFESEQGYQGLNTLCLDQL